MLRIMEGNSHEAKSHLSKLIDRALAGDEVMIASDEKEMPVLDSARGTVEFTEGWDDPLTDAELNDLFGI